MNQSTLIHTRLTSSRPAASWGRFFRGCVAALFLGAAMLQAQEPPKMPEPVKEHEWLKQFVGEWEQEITVTMFPGQPPLKMKGSETARMLGGFWVIGEGKGEMLGMPFSNILTIGYDPEKKKYVGTWVDSSGSYLWKYEGSVDATGKILTLNTEGPNPMKEGQTAKYKETTEFKSKDQRVFTSSILGEDGKWTTVVTMVANRKK
jgi:hypothetical protein